MTTPRTTHFNEAELGAYLDEVFPETAGRFVVEQVAPMFVRMRMKIGPMDLRPGGTISGPAMFTLADCAYYAVTLAMIGRPWISLARRLRALPSRRHFLRYQAL